MVNILKNQNFTIQFNKLISHNNQIVNLINSLSDEGELILIGGTVRAFFENQFKEYPRDIDIVINTNQENLDHHFKGIKTEKNRFGGYKIQINEVTFDIWSMPTTFAFKEKIINYKSPEDIVKIQFLSFDAIAFNLKTEEIYDGGYFDTINKGELEILLHTTVKSEFNIIKSFILKDKYNFKFSEKLNEHILNWIKSEDKYMDLLMEAQYSHYKKELLNKQDIQIMIGNLKD